MNSIRRPSKNDLADFTCIFHPTLHCVINVKLKGRQIRANEDQSIFLSRAVRKALSATSHSNERDTEKKHEGGKYTAYRQGPYKQLSAVRTSTRWTT